MAPSVALIPVGVPAAVKVGNDRMALSSFGDFYGLHYRPMVRLAQALVDTSECAEEIVQDAFAKVYERWDRLSEPGGYARIAVVNRARSELRKREVRRRVGLRVRPGGSTSRTRLPDRRPRHAVRQAKNGDSAALL